MVVRVVLELWFLGAVELVGEEGGGLDHDFPLFHWPFGDVIWIVSNHQLLSEGVSSLEINRSHAIAVSEERQNRCRSAPSGGTAH